MPPTMKHQGPAETSQCRGRSDGAHDVPGHPPVLEIIANGRKVSDRVRVACGRQVVVERHVEAHRHHEGEGIEDESRRDPTSGLP